MFKLRTSVLKYKKKIFYTNRVSFIKSKYRILISWTWLKLFIKSFVQKNNINTLHLSLENFLTSREESIKDLKSNFNDLKFHQKFDEILVIFLLCIFIIVNMQSCNYV